MIVVPTGIAVFFGIRLSDTRRELSELSDQINHYLEAESESALEMPTAPETSPDSTSESEIFPEGEPQEDPVIKPHYEYSALTPEEIAKLELSNEELYEGYRKVYLTFDDGPSSNTEDILDILAKYNVKATFFVQKKEGLSNEKLYRRIVDEGHSIGMHSTSHVYKEVYAGEEAFLADTDELRDYLYMVTGVETNLYRFPGGSSNHVSKVDMKVFAEALKTRGITYYDWNISSGDSAYPRPDANEIYKNVTGSIKKYGNAIILMHDTGSRDTTVEALPRIIEYILSLDDTVILPITEGTKTVQHLKLK